DTSIRDSLCEYRARALMKNDAMRICDIVDADVVAGKNWKPCSEEPAIWGKRPVSWCSKI
ncbi:MAG: hypothetical protein AAF657_38475, partial [Acidobacteriota bacterium]